MTPKYRLIERNHLKSANTKLINNQELYFLATVHIEHNSKILSFLYANMSYEES